MTESKKPLSILRLFSPLQPEKPTCCVYHAIWLPFYSFVPMLIILLFFGALFWAKQQDPFLRKWFTLKAADQTSFKCVVVRPKPARPLPVVIYVHRSGGTLMDDGNDLRQMAELGLVTVSLEYNQTNEAAFAQQVEALLNYLSQQKWVKTNAVAWVGFGLGAIRTFDFALQHPKQQPQLLIQLNGSGLITLTPRSQSLTNLHCAVLLVHSDDDEVFPEQDTIRLASNLQTKGIPVDLKTISGVSESMEPERGVIFRYVGEYCLTRLAGSSALGNYRSIVQWQAESPPFALFCLPAAAWAISWSAWLWYRKPARSTTTKLKSHEVALRWLAVLLTGWALVISGLHLLLPRMIITDQSLAMTRKFLVRANERSDFEYLARQPVWQGQTLNILLTHLELAQYNRRLINWQIENALYQDYVLSPLITRNPGEQINWRRLLWEECFPYINHESLPEDAAKIVVRHLRERITIATGPNLPRDIPTIWLRQITDEVGFEIVYVAALRSIGVPARLTSRQQAEYWDSGKCANAPRPLVVDQ